MSTADEQVKKSETALSEEQVLSFWNEHQIFQKSLTQESPLGNFVFYDGPPFATGLPHYGHLLAGTIKDVIPRYKTMRGYHVARTWGWDCHGLPLENLIEKELNLATKKDIEDYGIEKFNEAARNAVLRYEHEWKRYIPRAGRWVDMENPYMSMHPSYMESVWWIFSELNKKGLTKQGFKAMHMCPRCETTLANFEVNQGYQDVTDISVTATFELVDEPGTYLLAWTTTPWTLPGNVALAVGPDITYAKVSCEGKTYICAHERLAETFEGKEYTVLEELKGSNLVDKAYVPLFDYYYNQHLENHDQGWKVYGADFVTTEDGTGIVHIAPAFGSDDMELGQQEHLPFVQHVARNGSFIDDFAQTQEGTTFQGMKVKAKGDWTSTDIEIIKVLAHNGTLFAKKKLVHSYPHCWRCDTPLLNYATSSWFIDVPSFKDRLVELNQKVNWVPDHVGEGRFGKWLDGARDWALSRARFWGTPLPVWTNASGTETKILSSIDELLSEMTYTTTNFIGIRHGESVSNTKGIINSDFNLDEGLTDTGRTQVEKSISKLKEYDIDYVVASPFLRTKETAEILKKELKLKDEQIIVDERLRELQFGSEWEGKSWKEAHDLEESKPLGEFWNGRLSDDAESIAEIYERAMSVLFDMHKDYEGKTVLIVAHGGILKTLQFGCEYYGDEKQAREFYRNNPVPQNAEVVEFDFKPFPHNARYTLDLHRPYLDDVTILGSQGEPLSLIGDVFDVWFDSGSMPYAQVHYPFETPEDFKGARFPAQFIAEGLDQTRGWFYVLSVLGTALFDTIPFENVVVNGLILAEDGKKMSKSLNNYPDPYYMFDTAGADATRLYLVSSPAVRGEEFAFAESAVNEVARKVMGRTRNIMTLYQTYQHDVEHIEHFDSDDVLDQWIAARTKQLVREVQEGLESYQLDKGARPLFDFVDDFSTWYIRRSRDRFKSDDHSDKTKALSTTRMVLKVLAQVLAPFTPFIAEELWQELRNTNASFPESVHLSRWPVLETEYNDDTVLTTMAHVRSAISEGLQLRADAGIKVRQPLQSFTYPLGTIPIGYHPLMLDELNVKELIDGEPALDTNVTPELEQEGYARELLRNIQSLRKEQGLQPHDVVTLTVTTSETGQTFMTQFKDTFVTTANLKDILFAETTGETLSVGDMTFIVSME